MNRLSDNLHLNSKAGVFKNAIDNRQQATQAEKEIWDKLKNKRLCGFKFRRQHPLGGYIADFYCFEKKLVIEIDGGIHSLPDQKANDLKRTEDLEENGICVLRFRNEEVLNDFDLVIQKISAFLR